MKYWGVLSYIALNVCLVSLLLLAGCALRPSVISISEQEREGVETAFLDMLAGQQHCNCCIDATAQVSFKSWMQSGSVEGYLQAMAPAYLKFVGINPLGQPLMILVTHGDQFQYVIVPEAKLYTGNVEAKAFQKYAPEGFDPDEIFYWLTGRLSPEAVIIESVAKDKDGLGYWLQVTTGREGSPRNLILFDPQERLVVRHILQNSRGEDLMDVGYSAFKMVSPQKGKACAVPGEITVSSSAHRGSIHISLNDWLEDSVMSPSDFNVKVPAGFERIEVK